MKDIKVLFFIFIIFQGVFYLLLVPPWQSPDETHHFGCGALLSKNAKLGSKNHKIVSKEIVESMANFHAWQYQNIPRPEPMPQTLSELPYYQGIESVSGREPLYYGINSFILKVFNLKKNIDQFYLIRFLSLLYFIVTVYFLYLSSKLVFKDNISYVFATVCFVALLPQFLIITTSVNPVNLAVVLGAAFLYVILYSLFKGKKLIALLLGPIIIGLAFFNHRVALFMIPPFVVLLLIYFVRSLKSKREMIKIFVITLIVLLIFIFLFFTAQYFFPDQFKRVVSISGLKPRIYEINEFGKYISPGTSRSLTSFLDGSFKTFWFFAGWLRFGYHLDIYSVLKLICFLSVFGLFKYLYLYFSRRKYSMDVDFSSFLILIAAGLPIIFGAIIRYYPTSIVAQGRYVYPAISALAILFILGLKEIAPKRLEKWVPIFIIGGFMALNIYTIFHSMFRVFYYFTNA